MLKTPSFGNTSRTSTRVRSGTGKSPNLSPWHAVSISRGEESPVVVARLNGQHKSGTAKSPQISRFHAVSIARAEDSCAALRDSTGSDGAAKAPHNYRFFGCDIKNCQCRYRTGSCSLRSTPVETAVPTSEATRENYHMSSRPLRRSVAPRGRGSQRV